MTYFDNLELRFFTLYTTFIQRDTVIFMEENHPIPQDVTGFQFRLIGSLTVKQFGFLAAGTIFAVIFWYLPIPLFIKAPLVLLCGGSGVAIAFLPLEGRPLDVMLGNFIKDLFTPNQYIYQKVGGKLPISEISFHKSLITSLPMQHAGSASSRTKSPRHDEQKEKKLKAFLSSVHTQAKSKLDEKESNFLKSIFSGNAQIITMEDAGNKKEEKQLPEEKEEQKLVVASTPEQQEKTLEEEAEALKQALQKAQQEEQTQSVTGNAQLAHQNVLQLQQQLQEVLIQKQKLEEELLQLRQQLKATTKPQAFTPSVAQPPAESQNVRKIPVSMAKSAGFPSIPDTPNVLVGIVKDARENVLPNILVEVRDKDGNPVRAFKTNGLGQFASATALNNGTYTVEFEDPKAQHQFDTFELIVKGDIISPIEIISHDAREALRKELFS